MSEERNEELGCRLVGKLDAGARGFYWEEDGMSPAKAVELLNLRASNIDHLTEEARLLREENEQLKRKFEALRKMKHG